MADILIRIPERVQLLVGPLEALVAQVTATVDDFDDEGGAVDYAPIERSIREGVNSIECGAHGVLLSALDIDARRVSIRGKEYRRVGRNAGDYYTLGGAVRVPRTRYTRKGRGGRTIDIIAARIGAVDEAWLPQAARAMALRVAQSHSREAELASVEEGSLRYSRSSFERVSHAVGRAYVPQEVRVVRREAESTPIPAQAASMSIALDRVCVPMEEPHDNPHEERVWQGAGPHTGSVELGKVGEEIRADFHAQAVQQMTNYDGPKVNRVYRQAYCGTVTLHDAKGTSIRTFRFGKMPDPDDAARRCSRQVCKAMRGVAEAWLAQRPELRVAFLADGAKELWGLFERNFADLGAQPATQLVDLWHACEYLGAAARVLIRAQQAPENQLELWKKRLLEEDDAASEIALELEASGQLFVKNADGERPVQAAMDYLRNRLDRMHYAKARRYGLPVGSGNVEATCKSLVGVRMKRPGARWKRDTGDHILKLRALAVSDVWAGGIERGLRHLRRPVSVIEPRVAPAAAA